MFIIVLLADWLFLVSGDGGGGGGGGVEAPATLHLAYSPYMHVVFSFFNSLYAKIKSSLLF